MKKIRLITALMLLIMACCPMMMYSQSAKIDKFWIDLDAIKNGEQGLMGHLKFDVYGMKGKQIELRLFFYDSNKYVWMCQSNSLYYRTTSGRVLSYESFYPEYDSATFNDAKVFMPISQLHLAPGQHNYFCDMYVLDAATGKNLAESHYIQFAGTGVSGNRGYSGSSKGSSKWGATGAALGAIITGAAAAYYQSKSSGSSSSSSSSSSASTPSNVFSKNNVEIVDWGTMGTFAYSHAVVSLRNRNNYDVNVRISLYQGKWGNGYIIYGNYENSDHIPGVSDEFSEDIRIKANSMRKVYLKGQSRGKPTYIRIVSVR